MEFDRSKCVTNAMILSMTLTHVITLVLDNVAVTMQVVSSQIQCPTHLIFSLFSLQHVIIFNQSNRRLRSIQDRLKLT